MSGKTPLSDLLRSNAAQPTRPPALLEPSKSSGVGGWVLAGVLAVVLCGLLWLKFADQPKPKPAPDDDKQEQVEPSPTPKPAAKGKTLIFIHERNPQSIEHDLLLREMPKYCADHKLQFRALDDDLTEPVVENLVEFAKSKGIENQPFVVLTDADDRPWRVVKWPAQIAGLQELFK